MLVLARKRDEKIYIGSEIVIRVIKTGPGTVKIGIEAPESVSVRRAELAEKDITAEGISEDAVMSFEQCSMESLLVQN